MNYLTIAATALALSAGVANAATFNFDETNAPGGDFSNFKEITNMSVGTATAGVSSVNGALAAECLAGWINFTCNPMYGDGDQQDHIQFTIESGFELVDITVSAEGSGPTGMDIQFYLGGYLNGSPYSTDMGFAILPINTSGSFAFSTPLGAGTYAFSARGGNADAAGNFEASWNANFEVAATGVAAVPLPAGFPLLAAGLVGLGALARRKKSA